MKDRKFEISIMIILFTFAVVVIGCYLIYGIILEKQSYTLFLKPYRVLKCKKWNCEDVSNDVNKYNNKEYNTIVNGIDFGVNYIYYNKGSDKYYVFNTKNENLYSSGSLFGYSSKISISAPSYQVKEITKSDYSRIKDNLKLDFDENYIIDSGKISLDFDNDGELENLYYFYTGLDVSGIDTYFDYVIYENNSKFNKIIDNSSKIVNVDDIGTSSVTNILDIFDDGKLEFVLSSKYGATGGSCDVIYRLKGSKFVPVNECKIVQNRG